ncbi:MAG: hypothetical protein EBX44_15600 [Betaproteobacteria bacterium]|nr:hypothetical protein [Betaproteobacteria bacterium]NDG83200.1 hypothetical protein [Betaproteobacteria bacterium]
MNKMNGYAANLSPVSLVLPEYERFQIDGQRIGERTVAMAAKLPQPEPAAIIAISRAASSMPTISQPSSQQA